MLYIDADMLLRAPLDPVATELTLTLALTRTPALTLALALTL